MNLALFCVGMVGSKGDRWTMRLYVRGLFKREIKN
jgi:hypothetical protein